jgi:3-oxoacyl-ACP reductase-like protein
LTTTATRSRTDPSAASKPIPDVDPAMSTDFSARWRSIAILPESTAYAYTIYTAEVSTFRHTWEASKLNLQLNDKVIIVTGTAHGIGAATAAQLLDEGAIVIGADIEQ